MITVATPYAARGRVPVLVVPASRKVSEVIDTFCELELLLYSTIAVPIGNATEALAGMTKPPIVLATCLPASDSASV